MPYVLTFGVFSQKSIENHLGGVIHLPRTVVYAQTISTVCSFHGSYPAVTGMKDPNAFFFTLLTVSIRP